MSRSEDKQVISQGDSLVPVRRAVAMMVPGGDMMGADGAPQGPSNLDVYVHALRRTWLWCLIAGGVLAIVVGVAVYQFVPNRFTATAEVRASTIAPRLLNSTNNNQQEKYETFISNMQQVMQSRTTLNAALSDKSVKDDPYVKAEAEQEDWLASKLRVSNPKNSEVLLVSVTVPDPQLAANLANAVVEAYMNEVVAKDTLTKGQNLEKLEVYFAQLKNSEESMRADIGQLATSLGTIDGKALSLEQEIRLTQARQVKTELAKTKVERLRAAADVLVLSERQKFMEGSEFAAPPDEVELMVMEDPIGRFLMDEVAALDLGTKQATALTRKTDDKNPAPSFAVGQGRQIVQELSTRLERIREKMAMQWRTMQLQEIRTEIREKSALVTSLEDLEEKLAAEASMYDQQFKSFGSMAYKVQYQNEEMERVNTLADSISREIEIAKIEQASQPRIVRTGPAIVPKTPNRPGKPVLAGMAGFLAFFLPGLGLMLLDVRSQRVNSVHEVTDRLGLPVFGSVPMLPARMSRGTEGASKRGRRWQAVLSESVSGIRANLLRISDVRCVMVTSAIGGEGKTTVATQLAMSLARIGKRTALVDFDLPRPAINTVFDVPLEPGICDVLRCDYSIADVGHEVSLPNLTIITAGIADASSARYMNSGRIAEVLAELREQFDYVIVDGSPLIPVADARVVSRYVDGAICCVLRDVSRLKLIRQAVDLLATFNVRLLGTVVTGQQDTYYYAYEGDRESVQS